MIWNDRYIGDWAAAGGVQPYDPAMVNPASIDLRWSGRYRVYVPSRVDAKGGWSDVKTVESLVLAPGGFYLLDSLEVINMPEDAAGMLCLKSSLGRLGLEHSHAGWVDPGFHDATLTWEIHTLSPDGLTILSGQKLMQLVMMECIVPDKSYSVTGRYNGQKVPTEAK